MKNTLQLSFPIINGGNSKIVVEAGHIYTNEQPGLEHEQGAACGKFLSNYLEVFGADVEKWLFIDDYNPKFDNKPEILDVGDYLSALNGWGFPPDEIVYESGLVDHAKDVLEYLQKHCFAGLHNNGKIVLHKGNIQLYDPGKDEYMCALLDACLYLEKLERSDGCVTVLDQQYSAQQKGTLTILKKLETDTGCVFPFFYSTEKSMKHESADISNVFANGDADVSFVQPAFELIRAVAKLFGTVSCQDSSEMDVTKYGI